MKKIVVLSIWAAIFFLLGGCAATNKFSVVEYQQTMDAKFPPLAVFSKVPDGDFRQRCEAVNKESLLKQCSFNTIDYSQIYQELSQSGLFESVHLANDAVPYQLLISSAMYDKTSAVELGQAAVAGATLMLAPVNTSWEIHIDAALTWHGHLIRRYQYEIPFTSSVNLFSEHGSMDRDQARAVVSRLIADFQKDEALSPGVLYRSLEASNYETELHLPEAVGEYLANPLVMFRHPLYGAQARYEHKQFQFDFVDVFVYPIPSWEWVDEKSVLARESLRVRKEMEYVEKEGQWKDLSLSDDTWKRWRRADQQVPVLELSGDFSTVADEARYHTYAYLFLLKDKFVKVRASFTGEGRGKKDVESFAREVLASIEVPDESRFMARVRKMWRDERASQP
ncbi:hypothetical protein Q2E61_05195 [Microbulbifer thermotolerans]|uniref:hypothetical protein n=1 Tax=Microbulbifer thermotolerans TaxID=252514 RepID=UPI0026741144|nr:hypothetical protein [Microbulbifer thermotolerans]WKT61586.1 hypothetical protein Q2E61_05195 [Microbulbifer thermotolerans]